MLPDSHQGRKMGREGGYLIPCFRSRSLSGFQSCFIAHADCIQIFVTDPNYIKQLRNCDALYALYADLVLWFLNVDQSLRVALGRK